MGYRGDGGKEEGWIVEDGSGDRAEGGGFGWRHEVGDGVEGWGRGCMYCRAE